jgi:hypothetical protein
MSGKLNKARQELKNMALASGNYFTESKKTHYPSKTVEYTLGCQIYGNAVLVAFYSEDEIIVVSVGMNLNQTMNLQTFLAFIRHSN